MEKLPNYNRNERKRAVAKMILGISLVSLLSYGFVKRIEPDIQTQINSAERYIDCSMTFLRAGTTRIENTINTEFEATRWKTQLGIGLGQIYYGPFFVCPNR